VNRTLFTDNKFVHEYVMKYGSQTLFDLSYQVLQLLSKH